MLSLGGRTSCQLDVAEADVAKGVGGKVWAAGVGCDVCKLLHLVQSARMRAHVGEE